MSPWIMNRGEGFVEQMGDDFSAVCVSITESKRKAKLPQFHDLIRMEFQDYDGDRKHPEDAVIFTANQAARLARFLRKHRDAGKNIVVHCAAGISRSGAIVEAALAAFPEYEDRGWPRHPNGHVMRLMKRALGLIPIGAEGDSEFDLEGDR